MEFHLIILISLQIMNVISKKKYDTSSDESIENLLYFKDCQKKPDSTTHPPHEKLRGPLRPAAMDCPFPKMCCSISCGGNECGGPTSPFSHGQMEPAERVYPPLRPLNGPLQPMAGMPQPSMNPRVRKKKAQQPMGFQMPPMMGGRRDFGFTKDRIKSLINQDDDIRKILKDLVRVTMQKVDLVDMINTRKKVVSVTPPRPTRKNSALDEYEDEDLE